MSINNTTQYDWDRVVQQKAFDDWAEKNRSGNKTLDDATPEEWDRAAKAAGWGSFKEIKEDSEKTGKPYKPSELQIGGGHYKKFKIQPAEFCYKNEIPYLEATAIKYLCRWKDKGGIQDLEKAKHFIDLLIEFENANH